MRRLQFGLWLMCAGALAALVLSDAHPAVRGVALPLLCGWVGVLGVGTGARIGFRTGYVQGYLDAHAEVVALTREAADGRWTRSQLDDALARAFSTRVDHDPRFAGVTVLGPDSWGPA